MLTNHAFVSALSPSDLLAVVASVGSSLCGSDVDIVDPWDGNCIVVFSPDHSPFYFELLPLASLHPFLCSGDDVRSIRDDYSSLMKQSGLLVILDVINHTLNSMLRIRLASTLRWTGMGFLIWRKSFVNCSFLS